MDIREAFFETCNDLEYRCSDAAPATEYNLVKMAALLRLLLVDRHPSPLATRVRAMYGIAVRFPLKNRSIFDGPPDLLPGDTTSRLIYPVLEVLGPADGERWLGWDQFISYECAEVDGLRFDIRDLINYGANLGGGVHFDNPHQGHKFERLAVASAGIQIAGVDPIALFMQSVAIITLGGLAELRRVACFPPRKPR